MHFAPSVALRPHHMMCVVVHAGLGYGPDTSFADGFACQIATLRREQRVQIVYAADSVCRACPKTNDCLHRAMLWRDQRVVRAFQEHLNIALTEGAVVPLSPPVVSRIRDSFLALQAEVCHSCPWYERCEAKARSGFAGCLLHYHMT